MPDSDFPSGEQIEIDEVDQDSPLNEPLMNKFRDRDITLMDRGATFGGTGVDGDVTATTDPTVWGIDLATTSTAGPGTLSSSGTTVTISTTSGVNVHNYIRLNSGPQSGQYRKVVSITSSTVFEIETAFSASQTTVLWEKKIPKGIQNYDNFTTNAAVILAGLPDIPIIIFAKTSITINYHIEASGMGRAGGIAVGNNTPGLPGSGGISAGGAGGGATGTGPYIGGNGGDGVLHGQVMSPGGVGGIGAGGFGGGTTIMMENSIAMGRIMLGGGGGGGSAGGTSATGRNGGRGGGTIYLESPSVTLNALSFLRAEGNAGGNGAGDAGSGGGGGGGTIVIKAKTLVNNGNITATGGGGGIGGNAGGGGGIGLIYIEDY